MNILGLDIATTTGWAYSTSRDSSGITSGSFKGVGSDIFRKSGSLEDHMHKLLKSNPKPDFCVIEKPLGAGPNPATLTQLWLYFGSLKAVVRGYGIPILPIAESTWRETMYGFGRKKGWSSKEWKKHAKWQCETVLNHEVRNADEAEAVIISQYGFYTQHYKKLISEAA